MHLHRCIFNTCGAVRALLLIRILSQTGKNSRQRWVLAEHRKAKIDSITHTNWESEELGAVSRHLLSSAGTLMVGMHNGEHAQIAAP